MSEEIFKRTKNQKNGVMTFGRKLKFTQFGIYQFSLSFVFILLLHRHLIFVIRSESVVNNYEWLIKLGVIGFTSKNTLL